MSEFGQSIELVLKMTSWRAAIMTALIMQTTGAHGGDFAVTLHGISIEVRGPIEQSEFPGHKPFAAFLDQIAAQLNKEVAANFGSLQAAKLEVEAIYLPVVSDDPSAKALCDELQCAVSASRIVSPWLDLDLEAGARPLVKATVVWNERGFLLDQARLSGQVSSDALAPTPLSQSEWKNALALYEKEVLLAPSPEARAAAKAQLEATMPPDTYWLLSHAWQSTLAPFEVSVDHDLETFLELVGPRYADIVCALVRRGLDETIPPDSYVSIQDLQQFMDAGGLEVETLH